MTFAEWLDAELKRQNVHPYALSQAAAISHGRVTDYTSGRAMPTLANAVRIAKALGRPLSALAPLVDTSDVVRARRGSLKRGPKGPRTLQIEK